MTCGLHLEKHVPAQVFWPILNWFLFLSFQSIMSYNGGAIVAMKGKNCVAIAADKRFGIQAQTLALDFQVRQHDRMPQ